MVTLTTVAAVATMALLPALSWSATPAPTAAATGDLTAGQIRDICVGAAMIPPTFKQALFYLEDGGPVHRSDRWPTFIARVTLEPMPDECSGLYRRSMKFKAEFKTELRPWQRVRSQDYPSFSWWGFWDQSNGDEGLLGSWARADGRGSMPAYKFGLVTGARGAFRLSVTYVPTGDILRKQTRRVPMTFLRGPKCAARCG